MLQLIFVDGGYLVPAFASECSPVAKRHASVINITTGFIMTDSGAWSAGARISLFKIVTVRDEIVVGLDAADIAALEGDDVTAIGAALAARGVLTLMQYAVRKAIDGELEQAPLRRVSILGHDSLRVEPYSTSLRIIAMG